jgi:hypothetical protein
MKSSTCRQFKENGTSRAYFENFVEKQRQDLDAQYPELADLCGGIYETMNIAVRAAWENK